MESRFGFIYIWYDRKKQKYYIGSHWGKEDDGYICSSTRMRNAYNRRPSDFKRRILERHHNIIYTDLLKREEIWLLKIAPTELNNKYYNYRRDIPRKTLITYTETRKEKIRNTLKTKGIKPPNWTGKKHSNESKLKISQKLKENHPRPSLGRIFINDGKTNKQIFPENLGDWIVKGFVKGRLYHG